MNVAVRRHWVKIAASLVLTVASFATLASFVRSHGAQWSTLRIESPWSLALCVVGTLGSLALAGEIFRTTTARVGRALGFGESTALAVVGVAIDTVLPLHGGAVMRGAYLRRRHGLDVAAFVATLVGYNILRLLAAAILAFAATVWVALTHAGQPRGLAACLWVSGASAAAALAACWVRPGPLARVLPAALVGLVRRFHDGWAALTGSGRFLSRLLLLTGGQIVCEMIAVHGAWSAVGVTLAPAATALVTCFGILAGLTGLTPNGLGTTELVSVAVGSVVGGDPLRGVAASLLLRGVGIAVLACLAPLAIVALGLASQGASREQPNQPRAQ